MKRPLFVVAAGWASGIFLGVGTPTAWWMWLVATVLVGTVGAGVFYFHRRYLTMTLLTVACFAGAAHFTWVDGHNVSRLSGSSHEGTVWGRVASLPDIDGDRLQTELAVDWMETEEGRVRMNGERILLRMFLKSPAEKQAADRLERGTGITLPLRLKPPDRSRNPGAFDYREYLHRRQIHWVGEGKGWGTVLTVSPPEGFLRYADRIRRFLGERLETVYPVESAGLVRGMLLGERKQVPAATEEDFKTLGLVHLLAISGLHMGIFVTCFFGGLTLAGVTREKAAIFTMALIPLYILLTGAGEPVVRAGVMAELGLIALLCRKQGDSLSFLGAAALLLLWLKPYALFEAGFQLSFGVTWALLMAAGPIARVLPFPWKSVNNAVAIMLTAQVASFPLLLFHFHYLSWISWGVNLVVVPVISLIAVPLSYVALLLSLIHPGLSWLPAQLSSKILSSLFDWLGLLADWKGAQRSGGKPSVWWMAGYGAAALYLLRSWTGGSLRRRQRGGISLVVMVVIILLPQAFTGEKELRITFLDVGQGDCAVIETPEGQVILVDGGGSLPFSQERWREKRQSYDVGEQALLPFLRYRGINRINWLVMTHGDADHIGGLAAVVSRIPVEGVIRNAHPPQSSLEVELMETLRESGARIYLPPKGPRRLERGVSWQFLHPVGDDLTRKVTEGTNDDSVVFLLQAAGKRLLFTGDIGEDVEKKILSRWKLPPVDLLKVAHHGSRTSTGTDWLQGIRPREAIISAGRNNRFGHPTPEVLKRLKEQGSRIWRTDRDGALTVFIRPGRWRVEKMMEGGIDE
ncbi:DNA internalization-related competence protein ComEC/Rec2 [Salinithrix halophila]|uniref:DNA internalization-related competence protein ComEC/Rec2 n=1 Tax=Salinithrix halophila TaxID=1485204 RepID=A0ABV8JEB6_9BACL